MSQLYKISRRTFLGLCLVPSTLSASPLVKLQGGHGLFSSPTAIPQEDNHQNKFGLFHDPEPELDPTYSWKNLVRKPAKINHTQNLALLNLNTKETLRLKLKAGQKLAESFKSKASNDLTVVVYNFVDMLSHAKTEMEVLKELASNDKGYRSLTKSWFENSPLLF